jgi:hypothetical protein
VVFAAHPGSRSVFTDSLLTELWQLDEAGWDNYYKRHIEARDVASLLRHYGIHSTTVRASRNGKVAKGYKLDDFQEAWARYL